MSDEPLDAVRILILAPFGHDAPMMAEFLGSVGIGTEVCSSVDMLCREILRGAGAVALTEDVLSTAAIEQIAHAVKTQPSWSDLPIMLLTSQPSIERHVQSLMSLGARANITLVDRPVRIDAFISVARSLLRARQRQYEVRDLLEKMEQLVAQLNARVEERDRFLAVLGHELRSPLTAITLATELTDDTGRLPADHLQSIRRQTRTLTQLVNDLLDVTRVRTGKIELSKSRVDLTDFVRASVRNAQPSARAHRIRLLFHPSKEPLFVAADRTRLDQIIANLLTNAIKYTPGDGQVDVYVERDADQAVVRVSDDGVGIAREHLERVFEIFAQAKNAIGRSRGGLGIGLALVKDLVALHGGKVTATSDGEGCGSEFAVRLPLDGAATENRPSEPRRAAARLPRCSIVLVEDSDDVRHLLRVRLQHLGQQVEAAASGVAGAEAIARVRPQLAFIDIGLPDIDGYEVARRVREALGNSVVLVALTGFGQPEDRERALSAGFDRHITKPPDVDHIEECIRDAAERLAPDRSTADAAGESERGESGQGESSAAF